MVDCFGVGVGVGVVVGVGVGIEEGAGDSPLPSNPSLLLLPKKSVMAPSG